MSQPSARDRLFAEASREFLARGYEAANLDRIAKAAGISKKTIYQLVGTKLDLFRLVIATYLERTGSPDFQLAFDEDAEPALRRWLNEMADVALSPLGLATHRLVMLEGGKVPEIVAANNKAVLPYLENLVGWLAFQTERGWLRIASPVAAAHILFNMVLVEDRRNAILGLAPPPDAETRARRVDGALDIFLRGALAQPPD